MPIESAVVSIAVTAVFVIFALTVAWVSRTAR